jgi:ribose 5-phosphate isomerase B
MTDEEKIRDMVRRVVHRTLGTPGTAKSGPGRALVTELDLHDLPPGGEYVVPDGALITPLARQVAMERKVSLVEGGTAERVGQVQPRPSQTTTSGANTVAVGADHGGYQLKELLKGYLQELGYAVLDCGTDSAAPVDYPDFALAVAQLVAQGGAWRGIVVDGAGIGSCMAANKVPGVRASMCYDQATTINSRAHNDANVLTLGAGLIGPDLGRQIVKMWLETPAEGGRHARRVGIIMDIESRYLKKE